MLAVGRGSIRSVVLKFSWRELDAEVYKPLRVLDQEGLRVVVAGTNGHQVQFASLSVMSFRCYSSLEVGTSIYGPLQILDAEQLGVVV